MGILVEGASYIMNKTDIADIRKQFKTPNDLLTITHLYHLYVQKESSEVYHEACISFELLDLDEQELYFTNFKKVLTGKPDIKLFTVPFTDHQDSDDHTQYILHEAIETDDVEVWQEQMKKIVEKMFAETQYDKDTMITFVRGRYFKPTKQTDEVYETHERDEVAHFPFILCSMNHTEKPQRKLKFDYIEKAFKSMMDVDPIIKLTSPVGGFLFPTIIDHAMDVNHILYSAPKANKPDFDFIETVLDGEDIITAQDDKAIFEEIVKEVAGEEMDTTTLANVYEEISQIIEEETEAENEAPTLDYRYMNRVLKQSGIETTSLEQTAEAFEKIVEDKQYELKAASILPSNTAKSIKIKTMITDISVRPQDLKYVRKIHLNGKQCLVIEIDDDTTIDNFKIIPDMHIDDIQS